MTVLAAALRWSSYMLGGPMATGSSGSVEKCLRYGCTRTFSPRWPSNFYCSSYCSRRADTERLHVRPFALKLRKSPTPAEEALWLSIRSGKTGHWFSREVIIGEFVVDFHCSCGIVVEVDGSSHDRREAYDRWRERVLLRSGRVTRILRYTNQQCLDGHYRIGLSLRRIHCHAREQERADIAAMEWRGTADTGS